MKLKKKKIVTVYESRIFLHFFCQNISSTFPIDLKIFMLLNCYSLRLLLVSNCHKYTAFWLTRLVHCCLKSQWGNIKMKHDWELLQHLCGSKFRLKYVVIEKSETLHVTHTGKTCSVTKLSEYVWCYMFYKLNNSWKVICWF